jgi:DNA-binding MarR family transcriptional regulator
MSRVVSGLAKRRLVRRAADPVDGRGVHIALSASGRKVYGGLIEAAAQRDAAFRDCLSAREKQVLDQALTKLAGQARAFIQREKVAG